MSHRWERFLTDWRYVIGASFVAALAISGLFVLLYTVGVTSRTADTSTATTRDLVHRLDALQAEVNRLNAEVAQNADTIRRLEADNATLRADTAALSGQLRSLGITPIVAPPVTPAAAPATDQPAAAAPTTGTTTPPATTATTVARTTTTTTAPCTTVPVAGICLPKGP